MAIEEVDPVTGRKTTGHIWNGIKELDTPVPRGVLLFLIITHLFAILWWILYPTWPLGSTYTRGLIGTGQKQAVERKIVEADASRAPWIKKIETSSFDEIRADEKLMEKVNSSGRQLFGDNCAACHGRDGKGGRDYPDLTDDDWIWGGEPDKIVQTMTVGVNTTHSQSRVSQMPAFGTDEMLDRKQVSDVAAYVYSLSNSSAEAIDASQIAAGRQVFMTTCVACHGEDAKGKQDVGAPNLTDRQWIYGGGIERIIQSIHGGRQGHMPTWDERLSPAEIKVLALYVNKLGGGQQ
ncbi:cytochrome-c oxidase, cbb3-type subunit III [Rhizobium leguminosarum]|uniref:Cbb3-type cytochrome c oxidase subunit n=1 Tax=Rhizobium leguminosarum TaxID=384 RepID=A0A6P0AZI6_RHILE|nr:cytochrome-c oxidase, cbb3-type subunit III [Rhizobium leguminosarum]MBY5435393.1 cytochrome-c oxidase, cbb3-type subunit III [Rhizobium leguminosarum]NEI32997.1 cytochrome-c oxidase, cbb3-type subunit III [Rhizobium leguminosarum]NEI39756.1 cytochrome-c oxidase, cbb3-type subunit III [Rhizobium leguminosarum]